jgi:cytochrome c
MAVAFVALLAAPGSAWSQDAAQGKALFAKCQACHSAAKDARSGVGPALFGVVNRKAGSVAGFNYSPAMKAAGFAWTPQKLDAYLNAPAKTVPGNRMPFAGLPEPKDRQAIVAYLSSLR